MEKEIERPKTDSGGVVEEGDSAEKEAPAPEAVPETLDAAVEEAENGDSFETAAGEAPPTETANIGVDSSQHDVVVENESAESIVSYLKQDREVEFAGFKLTGVIAEGSMFYVLKGHYRDMEPTRKNMLAVKIPKEGFSDELKKHKAFIDSLDHPNISTILNADLKRNLPFVAEELADMTLEEELADGPLSEEQVDEYAGQIFDAIEYLHGEDVVHGDVNKFNILVGANGGKRIIITDFDLAEEKPAEDDKSLAVSVMSVASAEEGYNIQASRYRSPERNAGQPADKSGDLYSAAVVLFEMLSGTNVFGTSPNPEDTNEDLERDYRLFFTKALDTAEKRFDSVEQMRQFWTLIQEGKAPEPEKVEEEPEYLTYDRESYAKKWGMEFKTMTATKREEVVRIAVDTKIAELFGARKLLWLFWEDSKELYSLKEIREKMGEIGFNFDLKSDVKAFVENERLYVSSGQYKFEKIISSKGEELYSLIHKDWRDNQ